MEKRIFLISGKQGSGKTTYAKYFQAFLGLSNTKILKFAGPLYELHDACLPVLKRLGIRPAGMTKDGELLQVLGTEYGRKRIHENIWVDTVKVEVEKWLSESPKHFVIIDDCRFENEFDAFKEIAHTIRLSAPENVRKARCTYWREDTTHPSEIGLDAYEAKCLFDAVIDTQHESSKDIQSCIEYVLKHLGVITV